MDAPIRSAPAAKINASKTKGIQGKRLAFPWIPLAESGLFSGLQRIQIKNASPQVFTKIGRNIPLFLRSRGSLAAPDGPEKYSTHSDFRKDNALSTNIARRRSMDSRPCYLTPRYSWRGERPERRHFVRAPLSRGRLSASRRQAAHIGSFPQRPDGHRGRGGRHWIKRLQVNTFRCRKDFQSAVGGMPRTGSR